MQGFHKVCSPLLPSEQGRDAFKQRSLFHRQEGLFSDPWIINAIEKMSDIYYGK